MRKHFTQEKAHHLTDVNKHTLIKAVEENEEVLFQWCILTADTSNEDAITHDNRVVHYNSNR